MASSATATAKPIALLPAPIRGGSCCRWAPKPTVAAAARLRVSASAASSDVPDFLSSNWLETRKRKPFGPRLNFNAEEAVEYQLEALKYNDQPRQDYGIEVMYRFAGFDPFERSTYFGRQFDLGQFERFRRLFHHSTYRVLLGHKGRQILSSLWVEEVFPLIYFSYFETTEGAKTKQIEKPIQTKSLGSRITPRGRRNISIYNGSESWRLVGWLLVN